MTGSVRIVMRYDPLAPEYGYRNPQPRYTAEHGAPGPQVMFLDLHTWNQMGRPETIEVTVEV
jgi:hypothetical protein